VFDVLVERVGSEQLRAAHDARPGSFRRLDEPRIWWGGARDLARQKVVED
jgi:hypothetical protein